MLFVWVQVKNVITFFMNNMSSLNIQSSGIIQPTAFDGPSIQNAAGITILDMKHISPLL